MSGGFTLVEREGIVAELLGRAGDELFASMFLLDFLSVLQFLFIRFDTVSFSSLRTF